MVLPVTVTAIALPTFADAKVAVVPVVVKVTVSPENTPTNAAEPLFNVAAFVLSYTLLLTVSLEIVRVAGVIFATTVELGRV